MLPILYSFRRCPYAMRARLAILLSNKEVELREVVLRDKPSQMLSISPKATVPVLLDINNSVIDESLDIMLWAFGENDSYGYWSTLPSEEQERALALIRQCDDVFKPMLDQYKYFERYPQYSQSYYFNEAIVFLQSWEERLQKSPFLMADRATLADIAIFPFVRQFIHVDKAKFAEANLPALNQWFDFWLTSAQFSTVMNKYGQWEAGANPIIFPPRNDLSLHKTRSINTNES